MKKRKREKLNARKDKKRREWLKVKALQDRSAFRDLVDGHFPSGEFGCEECEDYIMDDCDGKGYTTREECLKCMKEKFRQGERAYVVRV